LLFKILLLYFPCALPYMKLWSHAQMTIHTYPCLSFLQSLNPPLRVLCFSYPPAHPQQFPTFTTPSSQLSSSNHYPASQAPHPYYLLKPKPQEHQRHNKSPNCENLGVSIYFIEKG
jgi:hypothetical protein